MNFETFVIVFIFGELKSDAKTGHFYSLCIDNRNEFSILLQSLFRFAVKKVFTVTLHGSIVIQIMVHRGKSMALIAHQIVAVLVRIDRLFGEISYCELCNPVICSAT